MQQQVGCHVPYPHMCHCDVQRVQPLALQQHIALHLVVPCLKFVMCDRRSGQGYQLSISTLYIRVACRWLRRLWQCAGPKAQRCVFSS
jgi:hypothetical protein